MANFKQYSRYTNGQVVIDRQNKHFLQLRKSLVLLPGDDDLFVTVSKEYEKRLDLLSNDIYGTPDLWWVICDFNNIQNPLTQVMAGTVLRVPSIERLLPFI